MEPAEVVKAIEELNTGIEKKYRSISEMGTEDDVQETGPKKKTVKKKRRKKPTSIKNGKKAKKRKSNAKLTAFFVAAALILIAAACVGGYFTWYNSFEDVSLAAQTSLVVSGYDGKGSAEVSLEAITDYKDFFDQVQVNISKDSELSNGESVTISYQYDEELAKEHGLRVNGTESAVTIGGLAIPTVVSEEALFDDLVMTTEDISPMITATIENVSEDEFIKNIPFEIVDPKAYYENGDVIQVKATIDQELALEYAYAFEGDKSEYVKEYPISSDAVYLTDANELTSDMLSTIVSNGVKYFDAAHAKEYGLRLFSEAHLKAQWENKQTFFSFVNIRTLSAYFNAVTEQGKPLLETHVNDVKVVYEATLTQPDGQACQAEVVVQYTDLIKYPDGTIDLKLDTGKIIAASCRNKNIKSVVSDTDDGNYISTKLDI